MSVIKTQPGTSPRSLRSRRMTPRMFLPSPNGAVSVPRNLAVPCGLSTGRWHRSLTGLRGRTALAHAHLVPLSGALPRLLSMK